MLEDEYVVHCKVVKTYQTVAINLVSRISPCPTHIFAHPILSLTQAIPLPGTTGIYDVSSYPLHYYQRYHSPTRSYDITTNDKLK